MLERMRADGYNLGGEQSGHIILVDHTTTGYGPVAALQIPAVVKRQGKPVSEICHRFDPNRNSSRTSAVDADDGDGRQCHRPGEHRQSRRVHNRQLAELVIELTGAKSRLICKRLPSDDPKQRRPDISQAHELLDWQPKVQLRDGLISTIAFFDKLLAQGESFPPKRVGVL